MADDNKTTTNTYSDGEQKIMLAVIRNITNDIQFDAEKVASELGYKSGSVFKTRWGQIKKKILADGNNGASPTGVKKRTPKASKGKAKEAEGGDDDEEQDVGTPVKTTKKRGRKPKPEEKEDEEAKDEDGAGEEVIKAEDEEVF